MPVNDYPKTLVELTVTRTVTETRTVLVQCPEGLGYDSHKAFAREVLDDPVFLDALVGVKRAVVLPAQRTDETEVGKWPHVYWGNDKTSLLDELNTADLVALQRVWPDLVAGYQSAEERAALVEAQTDNAVEAELEARALAKEEADPALEPEELPF